MDYRIHPPSSSSASFISWMTIRRNRKGGLGRLQGLIRLVGKGYELEATAFLLLLDVSVDRPKVVVETCGMFRPNTSNLIYNRVIHGITFLSSSGVQMIGTLYPLLAHTASIAGRMVALAMCRQFQVKR